MDKYVKLEDIINLIDSKINRMEEFITHNPSTRILDNIVNDISLLKQLRFEILKDNMGKEFEKWLKENNRL